MTYSEKLKDSRWLEFRTSFLESRRKYHQQEAQCDDCGEETRGPLHVHHRRYISGREPWEYDYCDLRLLCEECHNRIHAAEDRARVFIRGLPAHECFEMHDLLAELEGAAKIGIAKPSLAHAKNAVRALVSRRDTEEDYVRSLRAPHA